jgi:hypothetical protein
MGLLDDAIREHLELKRRRGEDATDVARQEQEALGPARRGPEPLEVPPARPAEEPVDPALIEPEVDPPEYEPPPVERHAVPEPEGSPAAVPEPEDAEDEEDDLAWEAPATDADAEAAANAGQPTVAFDAADVEAAQRRADRAPAAKPPAAEREREREPASDDADEPAPAKAEDVLEETPEFLQETPEHDRLWFEQRPPRDFDFDG